MRKLTLHLLSSFVIFADRLSFVDSEKVPERLSFVDSEKVPERLSFVDSEKVPEGFINFYKWKFRKYETVPYTQRTRFFYPSAALDREIGETEFEEFKQSFQENALLPLSHPDTVRATKILNNILDALQTERNKMRSASDYTFLQLLWLRLIRRSPPSMSHLDGLNWEILVVDTPSEFTCICYSGGKMVISNAVFHHVSTDAEIATLIAHEVAHIVARHPAEKIVKSWWILSLCMKLEKFISIDYSNQVWPLVLRLPFNRRFELEADYIGLLLMAAAGYDPRVVPKLFEKLGTYKRCDNDSMLTRLFFDTHPSVSKRAKALARPKIMNEALVLYNEVAARRGIE